SPSGAGPSPTAITAVDFADRGAASLVTSPALPVAPRLSRIVASLPSYALFSDSVPAGSVTPPSPFTTPITTTSDLAPAVSILLRLMVLTGLLGTSADSAATTAGTAARQV